MRPRPLWTEECDGCHTCIHCETVHRTENDFFVHAHHNRSGVRSRPLAVAQPPSAQLPQRPQLREPLDIQLVLAVEKDGVDGEREDEDTDNKDSHPRKGNIDGGGCDENLEYPAEIGGLDKEAVDALDPDHERLTERDQLGGVQIRLPQRAAPVRGGQARLQDVGVHSTLDEAAPVSHEAVIGEPACLDAAKE